LQSLIGQLFEVKFVEGRSGPICRVEGVVALPGRDWPNPLPKVGDRMTVRVVSSKSSQPETGRGCCFVLPEIPKAEDSALPNGDERKPVKQVRASEDNFYFSLPKIPEDAVEVRFRYRGKRLLGNYLGRPVDPNWAGWGIERQPKIHERWLVTIVRRERKEIDHAVAAQGPLNKKKT